MPSPLNPVDLLDYLTKGVILIRLANLMARYSAESRMPCVVRLASLVSLSMNSSLTS